MFRSLCFRNANFGLLCSVLSFNLSNSLLIDENNGKGGLLHNAASLLSNRSILVYSHITFFIAIEPVSCLLIFLELMLCFPAKLCKTCNFLEVLYVLISVLIAVSTFLLCELN